MSQNALTDFQVRAWFQKEDPSSRLNKTPPIGAPNAAEIAIMFTVVLFRSEETHAQTKPHMKHFYDNFIYFWLTEIGLFFQKCASGVVSKYGLCNDLEELR